MTRLDYAVGHRKDGKLREIAYRCQECERWLSEDDAMRALRGAVTGHGLCGPCAREIEERNDLPPEPGP